MNTKKFYETNSLYKKIDLTKENEDEVINLINFKGPIDIFCPWCKNLSVFNTAELIGTPLAKSGLYSDHKRIMEQLSKAEITGDYSSFISATPKKEFLYANKFYLKEYHCTRNFEHIFIIIFLIQNNKIFKIGQYPSELDLIQKDFKKYEKIIDYKIVNEVKTSFMLNSHYFNVSSLIHLRRAFEFFIEECHQIKANEDGWDETKYIGIRNEDKIELLKDKLPETFLKNKSIYGILSKGIHELTDEECKDAYEVLYPIFIMIFEELKFKRESELKELEIQKKKSDFESNFNKK